MSPKFRISDDSSDCEDNQTDSSGDANMESDNDQPEAEDRLQGSSSGGGSSEEDDGVPSKTGLADVFSQILRKKTLKKGPAILAKGQTDKEITDRKRRKKKEEAEQEGDSKLKKSKDDDDSESDHEKGQEQRLKRRRWEEMGRVKPDVLDRTVEKSLQKVATRGVVQLFNAVRTQQRSLEDKLKEVGTSESKREKVVQSMTKGRFLDMLKGDTSGSSTMNVTAEGSVETTSKGKKILKKEPASPEAEKPAWSILRDDFMMGAQMKDWDKQSEDEEEEADNEDNGDLDSDGDSDT